MLVAVVVGGLITVSLLASIFGEAEKVTARTSGIEVRTEFSVFKHNWQSDADCIEAEVFCGQFLPNGSTQEIMGENFCWWWIGDMSVSLTSDGVNWRTMKTSGENWNVVVGVRLTSTQGTVWRDNQRRSTGVAGSMAYWVWSFNIGKLDAGGD